MRDGEGDRTAVLNTESHRRPHSRINNGVSTVQGSMIFPPSLYGNRRKEGATIILRHSGDVDV